MGITPEAEEMCEEFQESQCHVTLCKGWEEERRGLDLVHIMDMVEFFQRILKKKAKKKKEGLL